MEIVRHQKCKNENNRNDRKLNQQKFGHNGNSKISENLIQHDLNKYTGDYLGVRENVGIPYRPKMSTKKMLNQQASGFVCCATQSSNRN